jgi:hypothetical protein
MFPQREGGRGRRRGKREGEEREEKEGGGKGDARKEGAQIDREDYVLALQARPCAVWWLQRRPDKLS